MLAAAPATTPAAPKKLALLVAIDGYDESIIPYDNGGVQDDSNYIRDDEIGKLLGELHAKTDNVVIALDSCHSGTGTRGALAVRGRAPTHPPTPHDDLVRGKP